MCCRIMVLSLLFASAFLLTPCFATAGEKHASDASVDEVRRAQRHVEIARLKLRQYTSSEYPLRMRELESEIKIAEAEAHLLFKRLDAFRYVSHSDRNDYGSPTTVNIRQMEIALLSAELHLEQLKAERSALIENDRSRRRLLLLELEDALDRLELLRPKAAKPKAIRNYRNAA